MAGHLLAVSYTEIVPCPTQEECKKIAEGMRPQVTKQIASFIESLNELEP